MKAPSEFELRRRVCAIASEFFACNDFALRRGLMGELLDAIVEYSADQKFVDPLSIGEARRAGKMPASCSDDWIDCAVPWPPSEANKESK